MKLLRRFHSERAFFFAWDEVFRLQLHLATFLGQLHASFWVRVRRGFLPLVRTGGVFHQDSFLAYTTLSNEPCRARHTTRNKCGGRIRSRLTVTAFESVSGCLLYAALMEPVCSITTHVHLRHFEPLGNIYNFSLSGFHRMWQANLRTSYYDHGLQ